MLICCKIYRIFSNLKLFLLDILSSCKDLVTYD